MKVIIIDDTNALLVRGWIWKKQAEVYRSYVYEGHHGWKYKLTDHWVVGDCHDAIMKAYGIKEPKRPPPPPDDPWVPVPKNEQRNNTKAKLPKARVLSLTSGGR